MKKEKLFMELNHETAMRLWNKSFGKATRATDFAGRKIAKASYNDRNSEFGWNVDHIYPQSLGGKTADHNLVCCHILTNDEKANKFPTFVANKKKFQIEKVENHYEIVDISSKSAGKQKVSGSGDNVNFYDYASGLKCFKKLQRNDDKKRFIGTVVITLKNVKDPAIIDFIDKIFDEENMSFKLERLYNGSNAKIVARNYDMPYQEDIQNLLEKCLLINTYLSCYFCPMFFIDGFDIVYRADVFDDNKDLYAQNQSIDVDHNYGTHLTGFYYQKYANRLYINDLVRINTEAKDKELMQCGAVYFDYSYILTKLSENLEKEVSRN